MAFGEPLAVAAHPWPRRQPEVRMLSHRIREAMPTTLREAQHTSGLTLPGPVPPTNEKESL